MLFTPDALAGRLPATRAEVRALFEHAFKGARREGADLALVALQLDGFEQLATERGVPYASALLCQTIGDLIPHLGDGVVCGWRERERTFLVIQKLSPADLAQRTHALVNAASRLSLSSMGGPAQQSMSVGTAHVLLPRRGDSEPEPEELVVAAGRCLRLAALAGGGKVVHAERVGARRQLPAPTPKNDAGEGDVLIPARPPVRRKPELLKPVESRPLAGTSSGPEDALLGTRVSRLERRLSKLSDLLEKAIDKGVNVPAEVEAGVASTYREVQGLSEEDESYEAKVALMSTIFEANLELHERHRDRSA